MFIQTEMIHGGTSSPVSCFLQMKQKAKRSQKLVIYDLHWLVIAN